MGDNLSSSLKRIFSSVANLCEPNEFVLVTHNEIIFKDKKYVKYTEDSQWTYSEDSKETVINRVGLSNDNIKDTLRNLANENSRLKNEKNELEGKRDFHFMIILTQDLY